MTSPSPDPVQSIALLRSWLGRLGIAVGALVYAGHQFAAWPGTPPPEGAPPCRVDVQHVDGSHDAFRVVGPDGEIHVDGPTEVACSWSGKRLEVRRLDGTFLTDGRPILTPGATNRVVLP